ncbi:MAG TPA: phosphoribosylaminoimidazolesuccinocarboxamide synthase [Bacteroidota bacterium]|nr:phosphoribosylaminoimidazolesuccinocarboxamide synthase [Bacteroidota bacterium]
MNETPAVYETHLEGLKLHRRGKVRDVYDLGDCLLIVATDRLSAFDVIMPQPVPFKGMVLTQISNFWFDRTRTIVGNHILATKVEEFPAVCRPHRDLLRGRSVLVKKARPLAIECVVRGYLAGSGWSEYRSSGSVCGIALPAGLTEASRLPAPIFTPATKAEEGHDENIPYARAEAIAGHEHAAQARAYALRVYSEASAYAESRGIIIADTKMEFGICDGELMLIDELLTPDSSRFWPLSSYSPGRGQKSFDKQYVRDYLLSIGFSKEPPGPKLPPEILQNTSATYREAMRLLTGTDIE